MNRCAVIAFLLFLLTAAGSGVTQKHVDISRPDGTDIRGTYYDDAGRPGPGILLLHMCNSERQAWRELAKLLAADGFHVLAIDYRGYGESGGDRFLQETQKQARLTAEKWPGDIDAAFTFLLRQPGVREEAVGVAGGSCGVNHAIHTARRHSEVHSLVLLAGPTDLEAEEFLLQNRWLPLFTAAAADDFYGAGLVDTMRWVADVTGNPRNRFVSYPTGGHGTMMFGEHPELMTQIVAWFRQTLVTAPASPQAKLAYKETPVTRFWQALLAPGDAPKAAEIYRETRQHNPRANLFPEAQLNITGYLLLQQGRVQDAVEAFRLNTEAYPESANAWDSFGDGYVAAGDKAKAAEAARRAIAVLDARKNHPERNDPAIRQNAEAKLK